MTRQMERQRSGGSVTNIQEAAEGWETQRSWVSPPPQTAEQGRSHQEPEAGPLGGGSALQRWVEAASAVDSFGAGRLSSLLTELVSTQSAAETHVRRLVLLIESSCRERRKAGLA